MLKFEDMTYKSAAALLVFLWVLAASVSGQSDVATKAIGRAQLAIDASGLLINHGRLIYNYRIRPATAIVVGLQTRTLAGSYLIDSSQTTLPSRRFETISEGRRTLDLRAGIRYYIGKNQAQRGFWFEGTGIVMIHNWRTKEYQRLLEESESIGGTTSSPNYSFVGVVGTVGYRYVFASGLSLEAYYSLRSALDFVKFPASPGISEERRRTGGFDTAGYGSFLTVGYVW